MRGFFTYFKCLLLGHDPVHKILKYQDWDDDQADVVSARCRDCNRRIIVEYKTRFDKFDRYLDFKVICNDDESWLP